MKPTKSAISTAGVAGKSPQPPQSQVPATVDWAQYSGEITGFEQVGRDDLGIPFLIIVQKGSPEVDKTHKDYATKHIIGAEVGDVVNTLSRTVLHKSGSDPVIFIPCYYNKSFVEWKPRESGGGFVKAHSDEAILGEVQMRNEKNQDILRNGNVLVTTAYFFGLVVRPNENNTLAVIGMTSTQLKKARNWLNMMTGIKVGPNRITPPMFSHKYTLRTVPESNPSGSWMGWKIDVAEIINDQALVTDAANTTRKLTAQTQKLISAPVEQEPVL